MGYGKEITIKMVNKKYKDSYAIENLIKYTVTDKKRKKDCRYRGGHGAYYMNAKKQQSSLGLYSGIIKNKQASVFIT